jgi:3-oxoacyl-[acyl-carrier-protein] synthase-3
MTKQLDESSVRVILKGYGYYLPKHKVTNDELSKNLETNDDWITQRTGIKSRHIAADNELTSDLAYHALTNALYQSSLTPHDIDGIIVATSTPDLTLPSTACAVQKKLCLTAPKSFAFDINAACSGFVYALTIADGLLSNRIANRIAIIGADTYSRIVDWQDRSTAILFGDGAGCFLLEQSNHNTNGGIMASKLIANGSLYDILKTNGGVSSGNCNAKLEMSGREVFRHAIEISPSIINDTASQAGISVQDIDMIIPHQANARISAAIAKELNLPINKIASTIEQHANTSAASIPLTMANYLEKGLITKGQIVALCGFGAGFTAGCVIMKI